MQPPAFTCVGSEEWIKCKQLLLIPSRTAIAMQLDDGDDVYELREDLNSTERELVIKWIESR